LPAPAPLASFSPNSTVATLPITPINEKSADFAGLWCALPQGLQRSPRLLVPRNRFVSRITALSEWMLRRALVWGSLACFAFYVLVVQGLNQQSTMYRYFAGDGWEIKATTALLFFTGLAALALKLFGFATEFGALHAIGLPAAPREGNTVGDVPELLAELDQALPTYQHSYFSSRLRQALQFVRRKGSADSLESQLPLLDDAERQRLSSRYSAIRAMTIAMPMLGLFGAIVAAAVAFHRHSAEEAALDSPALVAALGGALDGAAQALALTCLLLLAKYGVERVELRLLHCVGNGVDHQLVGRFRQYGAERDPQVAAIQRMCEKVLASVEAAVVRQDAAVVKSVATAGRQWEESASAAAALIHRAVGESLATGLKEHAGALNEGVARQAADLERVLVRHAEILSENIDQHTTALVEALEHHGAVLTESEKQIADEHRRSLGEMEAALGESMLVAATRQEQLVAASEVQLKELHVTLAEAAGASVAQQELLAKQADVLLQVVESTAQVRKLEEALNSNLASLAGAHHFEQTVVGLSAALQLLSVNLARPAGASGEINLASDKSTSRAA
jgi:hypothetical protein